jgi:hypothetical protein
MTPEAKPEPLVKEDRWATKWSCKDRVAQMNPSVNPAFSVVVGHYGFPQGIGEVAYDFS